MTNRGFCKIDNEAILEFSLRNKGPLLINSGTGTKLRERYDMSPVKAWHYTDSDKTKTEETVYLPGSSIKGVFRVRYEQLMRGIGAYVCNIQCKNIERKDLNCSQRIKILKEKYENKKNSNYLADKVPWSAEHVYKYSCEACRLFGSLAMTGRLSFSDAYPDGDVKIGFRHGVAIDRITGAAHPGAKYEMEVVENGTFNCKARFRNYEMYQLRMILWILEDIDDGLVTLGMGGSRGNGLMKVTDWGKVSLTYHEWNGSLDFHNKITITGKEAIIDYTQIHDMPVLIEKMNEANMIGITNK
jgi:CRISPR-associated RAMP protein (TIGR02581 family)